MLATIKDIAKIAKVSTGTVDRVIHNRPGVSKKTKAHIEKIIKKNDFQVNEIARTLALNKNYKIAVIIPDPSLSGGFWNDPKKGIDKAIKEIKNYRVSTTYFFFNQFDPKSYTQSYSKLKKDKYDAVLIAPVFYNETKENVSYLDENEIPYIFMNIEVKGFNALSFIGQDSHESGFLAAKLLNMIVPEGSELLIPTMRKNIDNYLAIDNRISGFKSFFKEGNANLTVREVSISSNDHQEVINTILNEQFENNNKIQGIFVPSSYSYLIAEYLESNNKESIRLFGYDINKKNYHFLKRDTIDFLISQEPFNQGYKAMEILKNLLLLNQKPKKLYCSPIKIVTKENVDYI